MTCSALQIVQVLGLVISPRCSEWAQQQRGLQNLEESALDWVEEPQFSSD